ncbi:MAG: hypothetical protein AAGJ18_23140, partial [Bacteroidota bacterium]
ACEAKIANPQAVVAIQKTSGAADNLDIRSTARNLTKQVAMLKEIFDYEPAHADDQMPEEQTNFVRHFNQTVFLEKCAALRDHPEISLPKYKRQLKEVLAAENYIEDLIGQAEAAGVFERVSGMRERIEKNPSIAERFRRSTLNYIDALVLLMPHQVHLPAYRFQINWAADEIAKKKQAAAAKAQRQADARAAEKAAAAAAAAKAESGLPVAGLKDARLESEFKQLAQAAIGNSFKIQRMIIMASKWGVNNDALGRPIARSMITYGIGKDASGQCFKQAMTFTQNYNGGSYGRTYYDSGWAYPKKKIDCDLL